MNAQQARALFLEHVPVNQNTSLAIYGEQAAVSAIIAATSTLQAQCERQRVAEWQPIETAPTMRNVLLFADTSTEEMRNHKIGSGYFSTGQEQWIWEGELVREWSYKPSHWMPLPAAPASLDGESK